MKILFNILFVLFLLSTVWVNDSYLMAQSNEQEAEKEVVDDGREWMDIVDDGIDDTGYLSVSSMSQKEKAKTCKKYEGKYVTHLSGLYKIEKCSAISIKDQKVIFNMQQKGLDPVGISSREMRAFVRKNKAQIGHAAVPSCKKLEGLYLTQDQIDIYFVENCRKRLFYDYHSFNQHRTRRSEKLKRQMEVTSIPDRRVFQKIKDGEPMTSFISKEYAEYMRNNRHREVEIISIEEACIGIEGKFVSYLQFLYKIEDCKKRSMDPVLTTRKYPNRNYKEITGEVWVSLPEGKPL